MKTNPRSLTFTPIHRTNLGNKSQPTGGRAEKRPRIPVLARNVFSAEPPLDQNNLGRYVLTKREGTLLLRAYRGLKGRELGAPYIYLYLRSFK